MAVMGKQRELLYIQAGYLNAAGDSFIPFAPAYSTGVAFNVWNASIGWRTEYLGATKIQTLTGYEKTGLVAYRGFITINLKNTTQAEAQKIRTLLGHVGTWGSAARPGTNVPFPALDVPTVFNISDRADMGGAIIYNLETGVMEAQRELSINSQIITLSFSSVFVRNTIPEEAIV
jgi:hypothetical protein